MCLITIYLEILNTVNFKQTVEKGESIAISIITVGART